MKRDRVKLDWGRSEIQFHYVPNPVGGVDSYLKKAVVGDYLIGVSSVQFLISKEEITHVKKGECYLPYSLMSGNDLKAGNKLTVTLGDTSLDLTVRGEMLDAVMGSDFISIKGILLNWEYYEALLGASASNVGMEYKIYSIDVKDMQEFTNEFLNMGITAVIDLNYDTLKMTYIIEMIIAVIFGVVSVVLIIIALVVLRFTVIFTLEQEYREIGILKALGIKNSGIRLLYLEKYIFLTVIGSLLGLVLCVPLGNVMAAGASRRIMLEEDNTLLLQGPYRCRCFCR